MYFEQFPYTYYSFDGGKTSKVITNILLRNVINSEIKNNLSLFDEYDIVDGETPEILADKFYSNSQLHWVILLYNDILDPRYDWPLSQYNLKKYCENKYTNTQATHHYVDSNGRIVNSTHAEAVSVSNFQYEDELNESKRRIKILKPMYVDAVAKEFAKKISL